MHRCTPDVIAQRLDTTRTRRQVLGSAAKGTLGGLATTAVASAVGAGSLGMGFARRAAAQETACPSPGDEFVRPDVYMLTAEQINSLRRGVAVMKSRPDSDHTSWMFQANLHAAPGFPEQPTWCQHSSWFFFPWHRMYLYWFERILRDASGDPSLALPYWNYSDDPAHSFLPVPFRSELDEDGNPNPLFEARRAPGINDATIPLTPGAVTYSGAFSRTNFFVDGPGTSFGGRKETMAIHNGRAPGDLEITPHGNVHVELGELDPTGVQTNVFGLTFPTAATLNYECSFHPTEMQGSITITTAGPPMPDQIVDIIDNAFVPKDLTITAGTAVVWINYGATSHTVTWTDIPPDFNSPELIAPGLMAWPKIAARDPIFWLHHANIDRLWNRWLDPMAGKTNPPVTETAWYDQVFSFFDETGAPVELTAKQVVEAATCLGVRYDDDPAPPSGTPVPVEAVESAPPSASRTVTTLGETSADQPVDLGAEPVTVSIDLAGSSVEVVDRVVEGVATPTAGGVPAQLILSLEDISYRGGPLVNYEVYVNPPSDGTADFRSDSFVGNIYVFGLLMPKGHQVAGQGARQDFDITPAVQAAQNRGNWQGDVAVSFAPLRSAGTAEATPATPRAVASPAAAAVAGPSVRIKQMVVAAIE